ncbi:MULTISPECIES: glutathione peroxidase [Moraxella]|uniref:Glutathione peroxidase n=1 Tax=Moraxella catarrhalis TaxID=480 RepID=A0A198UXS5_MORCA|nr:glutathione peroxidase [Moraxella catarrhalis]OAU95184.1 Glutathione peroxidase [Moraxella catarrhalis]OAU96059.1 Glutathione peroxidase [Moraxella catarrhalis]OAV01112.1 Glutathione peroxidase [Moraxella catarrhalis]OAV02253.1 Glutathione peroxidase [Moraxella catarrhalis]STY81616.1 Glutathione peroxidase homolog BsaA [Moraxella catarrhalis]
MTSVYDFSATDLTGQQVNLSSFKGKVLLIVNTASQCGFTPQFAGLQVLHDRYHAQGLVIIGFACNQFGNQEPNTGTAIGEFCQRHYGAQFLMMDQIKVNGDNAHPLFQWLKSQQGGVFGDAIKWNFTKFLIGRDGQVIKRYAPITKPESLTADIEKALKI